MNYLKFIVTLISLSLLTELSDGQPSRKSRRLLPGKPGTEKTRKKQAAMEKKMKKDYALFVKRSRKRSISIQSPEVQERMKQNHKNTKDYYKSGKKSRSAFSKNARKKYKK